MYYGLPLDYFNTYAEHVGRVTEAEVKKSAAAAPEAAPAVFLVVGDGDAKMIVDDPSQPKDKRRVPLMKDGMQVTLRRALQDLAAKGDVGAVVSSSSMSMVTSSANRSITLAKQRFRSTPVVDWVGAGRKRHR